MLSRPKSTVSIRNSKFKFNFNSNNNSNLPKLDNNNNFSINQSPKLFSGKMRYLFEDQKLFSLLDLNEKITNYKGPSLPIQFKRLTSEEIHNLFPGNYTKRYEKLNKLKNNSIKNTLLGRIIKQKENNKEANIINDKKVLDKNNEKKSCEINITDIGNNSKEKKNKKGSINQKDSNINEKKEINIMKEIDKNKSQNEEKENVKRPNTSILAYKQKPKNYFNTENIKVSIIKEEKKSNNKNDIWKPDNYKHYEESVKDRKVFFQRMKENPFFNRLPSCTLKEIQEKAYSTDIFFVKPPKSNSEFNYFKSYMNNIKNHKNNCYYNSDILNIKNDELSLKKIGEKYLFQIPQNVKYTSSRESHSEWTSALPGNSINNCSSKDYNILIPNRINNNMTKEKAYMALDKINYNKNNPITKQRSVSKFIDLANNKKSNFGIDYMNCFQTNPNCFKKVAEHCSSYGDLFLEYKNICKMPFYKKSLTIE